jgi:cobalt-zinc-cadmium efflux system outer membrane protein
VTTRTAIGIIASVLSALMVPEGSSARQVGPQGEGTPGFQPPTQSSLGQLPGSGGTLSGEAPDASRPFLGGGANSPIVPPSISNPGSDQFQALSAGRGALVPSLPEPSLPIFGPLSLPAEGVVGPPDGLTLDQAVQLLVRNNLDLRSRFLELPQARADILTASLYPNPLLFADAQLIPYGNYDETRPGGPIQYDINISHPVDVTGKVRARMGVAGRVYDVVEAQYRDTVRVEIDNLYRAFVSVLLARETVAFSRAAVSGLDQFLETVRDRQQEELATQVDVNQVLIIREQALVGLDEAIEAERVAKLQLGTLLNLPPDQADRIEVRGTLFPTDAPSPPLGEPLLGLAMQSRPDLLAFRLGIESSRAEQKLAEANRLADIYVLFQPYTFQDNDIGIGDRGSHSWALGVTAPLPIYNRNQGNIQRARYNVEQTRLELAAQERRVIAEVLQAEKEYLVSRAAAERLRQAALPAAQQVLDTALVRYRAGEQDLLYVLAAYREYNGFVRQYLSSWLRYRRAMLSLNTAVGRRILP